MQERNEDYKPMPAMVKRILRENAQVKTFRLRLVNKEDREKFSFRPGQFAMVSVTGIGEAPLSVASPPEEKDHIDISVRKVGDVTGALFRLKSGDIIGIRGPYGNGFPVHDFIGRDVLLVAGGIGFPPIASVIDHIIDNRKEFGRVWVLYGARDMRDIIYRQRSKRWDNVTNVEVLVTVEKRCNRWKGCTGVVTNLFDKIKVDGKNTVGLSCGPPTMLRFVTEGFMKMGIRDSDIYISLERMMQCGIGKCGHCSIGDRHVCTDGPVFRYSEIKGMLEQVW